MLPSAHQLWCSWQREAEQTIYEGDPAFAILGTGGLLIGIGFWLMLPFDSFLSSPSYRYLAQLPISEWQYGFAFLLIGLAKWLMLAYNSLPTFYPERFRPSSTGLYAAATLNFVMCVIWVNMTVGVVVSNPEAWGWLVYTSLTLASLWASNRRFRQARLVQRSRRRLTTSGRL